MRRIAIVLALLITATVTRAAEVKTAGIKMIPVSGGKYRVWTKRMGHSPVKMLTLHGGPGATHEYLESFEDFLPQQNIEFYYYDQLGSGNSDQPDDASLWTLDRFRGEVEDVRAGLALDHFYLYGSSWGGMLAIEYALAHPEHLKAVVISDMTASIDSYVKYANELRAQLPKEDIAILDKYEATGDYNNPEYQQVMMEKVYTKHLCRLDTWPEPLERAFRHLNQQIYNTMQGPNEFVVTGNLKSWDRWNDLARIKVPVLLIVGKYDTMSVDDMRRMGELIPHSRFVVLPNGSHMGMWDDQENYFRALTQFVHDVEAGTFKADPKPAQTAAR
ncbi:MAG TPA: proline iminopeptidase-family hydrolase [Thermoanaerobaculia bacterium]|nr:proline iminopeptidase-family hydrolase [Thermoanaerobaculia bacterium]